VPPLSVLDLSPVPAGGTAAQAVRDSVDLGRHADRLGFHRHWLAEHHAIPSVASSAPEVLIGHVAAATERIRVGSGGIMLPNHAPLRIAEEFRVLEALHPGRIDLGIGRAPGTDQVTALALRRSKESLFAEDFTSQLGELLCAAGLRDWPAGHPFSHLRAIPDDVDLPPIFLLGSSDFSAQVAALNGMGFAFAAHINPHGAVDALQLYRERFVPSPERAAPHAILTVAAIVGDDDAHAERLAAPARLAMVRLRQGRPTPLPTVEDALAWRPSADEEALLAGVRRAQVTGGPERVRERLDELLQRTGADELMVTTHVHEHADRLASYDRLAEAFHLRPLATA
jgi:luciferase family oxidoreductase group 1